MCADTYSLVKVFCISCWVFFWLFPRPSKIYGPKLKGAEAYSYLMFFFLVGAVISTAILIAYKSETCS